MDYQQPHGYMRRLPPPAVDPNQRPPPSVGPPPPIHAWSYSTTQFQYQPQTQHSTSPSPPQWPPPNSSEHAPFPPHPPASHCPAYQPQHYPAYPHYPPPHPLPSRPPHVPQSYSQDWGSGSWSHHQSWQFPSNNNEEDWGAKAKAWATAKAATENQQSASEFVPAGRPEEQNYYRDQYCQSNDPHFVDVHTQLSSTNYQQYPTAVGPSNRTGLSQLQDSQYISSRQSSYAADMHVTFAARNGILAGDTIAPSNPLFHQQEVPSSYSSVAGNEEDGDRYEKFNNSSSLSVAPLSQQPLPPAGGRTGWMEEPHNFGSMPAESAPDLNDQQLNFAPHFNRNLDPHAQPSYTHSSGGLVRGGEHTVAISSNYACALSMAQGSVYQPMPPSIPPGTQVDHRVAMPSPASGYSAPMIPTGPSFQPTVPVMGAAFGVGAGVTHHPTSFPGDACGVSVRPKKAAVPNWLREEIIKNKAVMTSSAPEIPKDDSQSIEEDSIDKSSRKGYQVDSKSIDSSRSTEDQDEDEDEVEAARTAAINQEIKRVLTEVLLKVTDELFDEIAAKVLKEDSLSFEVGRNVDLSNHRTLLSTHSVLTHKASAKVLIPIKTQKNYYVDASEKSTSGTPGDVLGLGSYASDEEDDEIQSSGKINLKESSSPRQYSSCRLLEGNSINGNGGSSEATQQQIFFPAKLDSDGAGRKNPASACSDCSVANMELNDTREARDLACIDDQRVSKKLSWITEDESNFSKLDNSLGEVTVEMNEDRNSDARRLTNEDSKLKDSGNRYDKNDTLENKRSSAKKGHMDSGSFKERLDKKGDGEHGRRSRTERTDYHLYSKDKGKEKGGIDEKVKNTVSKKPLSPSGGKEGTTETQREKKASGKKDINEKRQDKTADGKREWSRHKSESESSRHKRHHSSLVGGRESKDNMVVSCASGSESSDDSRRKSHQSKRRKSPSPIRSRRRQVSQSPHSKHSKHRHSSYSSLETTRGKRSASRSRSRSPVHRRR